MEPWQQEALEQQRLERKRQGYPRCRCCDEPITTEYYLDLTPFGLNAKACEACTDANTHLMQL